MLPLGVPSPRMFPVKAFPESVSTYFFFISLPHRKHVNECHGNGIFTKTEMG
jgi:hypothetical protein